jgi:hypothetical protein
VATDFSGWCFGAQVYWAAFVTSIYANTDTYIQFSPQEILLDKPETSILLTIELGGWDPDDVGVSLKTWQAQVDSAGYTSGLAGALTVQRAPCTTATEDVDCKFYDLGSICHLDGFCTAGWQNEANPPDPNALLGINAVDISQPDYRYGSTSLGAALADPGVPVYGGHLALDMLPGSMGTFTVGFLPDPNSFMKDGSNNAIPLVGLVPAKITVQTGKCCVPLGGGAFDCVSYEEGPYMTVNDCDALGGIFTAGETCDPAVDDNDECGCTEDWQCDDSDVCTDDWCDVPTGVCNNDLLFNPAAECCDIATGVLDPLDDGNQCTSDYCSEDDSRGYAVHDAAMMEGMPCEDDIVCDSILETCQAGVCTGIPITTFACAGEADPDAYCKGLDMPETSPASCNTFVDACICIPPSLNFEIMPSDKPNGMCFAHGEKMEIDVFFSAVPQNVVGGQFTVMYDPDCVEFVSIEPAGDPYIFEMYENVDEAAGMITYAVGVDPFGGEGTFGEAALATMSFVKLPGCTNCVFEFAGENPINTYLSDDDGQAVTVTLNPSAEIHENDKLSLVVPADIEHNVDCDMTTAMVAWDWPYAASSCYVEGCDPQFEKCYDPMLECWGSHESGYQYPQDVVYKGGELPIGVSTFYCIATSNICGDSIADEWTVTVNDQTTLDLTIQLSPMITGDVTRCIEFELFANCVEPPLVFSRDIFFGGIWDHIGHFTDTLKIPDAGQWLCITARDQLHSLRSVSDLPCVDGVYVAEFKGDPFFGGNWLVNGNLDGWKKDVPGASHDVIDILDFGQFVANFLVQTPIDTECVDGHAPPGPHADINADGIVDGLDFAFVLLNYLMHSKDSCCPDSAAAATEGRTSISVRELRALGMGDLAVADLNGDGMVDGDDMAAFMAGQVPTVKPTRSGSSLR